MPLLLLLLRTNNSRSFCKTPFTMEQLPFTGGPTCTANWQATINPDRGWYDSPISRPHRRFGRCDSGPPFGIQKLAMCFKTIKTRVEGLHRKKWMICRERGCFPLEGESANSGSQHRRSIFFFAPRDWPAMHNNININILSGEFNFYTDTGNISGLKNNTSSWQIYGKYPGRS